MGGSALVHEPVTVAPMLKSHPISGPMSSPQLEAIVDSRVASPLKV